MQFVNLNVVKTTIKEYLGKKTSCHKHYNVFFNKKTEDQLYYYVAQVLCIYLFLCKKLHN